MAQKVIVKPEVIDYLTDLINILYIENYFSLFDISIKYVDEIIEFISTIPSTKYKTTKNYRFGKYYSSFKINKHTTWYVIFDVETDIYLVQFITNNHSADYPKYII